jgi:hypothetical protein
MTGMQTNTTLAKPSLRYTLSYGMRLDKVPTPDITHPPASVALPDGSAGRMTLQVTNGTADEIKARLLQSIDAFFQEHAGK